MQLSPPPRQGGAERLTGRVCMRREWIIGLAAVAIIAVAGITAWEWRDRSAAPPPVTPPQPPTAPAPRPPSIDPVPGNPQRVADVPGRPPPSAARGGVRG